MLLESSSSTATKFRSGTAAESSSIGRYRQRTSTTSDATRSPLRIQRSRRELFPRTPAYVMTAGPPIRSARVSSSMTDAGAPNTRSPLEKTSGLYLKKKEKTDSTQLGIDPC